MAEAVIAAPEEERHEPRYRAAFHALAEERAALHKDEVLRVNADAMLTITTMLGAWPGVRALREPPEAGCPGIARKMWPVKRGTPPVCSA